MKLGWNIRYGTEYYTYGKTAFYLIRKAFDFQKQDYGREWELLIDGDWHTTEKTKRACQEIAQVLEETTKGGN